MVEVNVLKFNKKKSYLLAASLILNFSFLSQTLRRQKIAKAQNLPRTYRILKKDFDFFLQFCV